LKLLIFGKTLFSKENYEFNTRDWISQLKADSNCSNRCKNREDECNEGIIENAITIDIHQGQANAIEQLDKTKTIMCTVAQVLAAEKHVNY
jgi:uncharacterized Fe-S cluster-containing protein